MPNRSVPADTLRRILQERAHLIQLCFDRSFTVEQAVEYLTFAEDRKKRLPLESLSTEEGAEVIREVFWTQQEREPITLLQKVLGYNVRQDATLEENLAMAAQKRPWLLSWIPARFRQRAEAALRRRTYP